MLKTKHTQTIVCGLKDVSCACDEYCDNISRVICIHFFCFSFCYKLIVCCMIFKILIYKLEWILFKMNCQTCWSLLNIIGFQILSVNWRIVWEWQGMLLYQEAKFLGPTSFRAVCKYYCNSCGGLNLAFLKDIKLSYRNRV